MADRPGSDGGLCLADAILIASFAAMIGAIFWRLHTAFT